MSLIPAALRHEEAAYEILTYPHPALKERCQPVSDFGPDLRRTLDKMLRTMYLGDGIGLAAPQVGILKRMVVIDVSADRRAPNFFVNPEIISRSGSTASEEGCLSVPGFRETIKRSAAVTVRKASVPTRAAME